MTKALPIVSIVAILASCYAPENPEYHHIPDTLFVDSVSADGVVYAHSTTDKFTFLSRDKYIKKGSMVDVKFTHAIIAPPPIIKPKVFTQ